MAETTHSCANCNSLFTVTDSAAEESLLCPRCAGEFHAATPEASDERQTERIPFFKFSRRKLLKAEMDRLIADGEYSEADHNALVASATRLRLKEDELDKIRIKEFTEAFKPLKARIYETAHVTDDDVAYMSDLSRRFHITIREEPPLKMCREIYLMEAKGENPLSPIGSGDLMLDSNERLYYSVSSTWGQLRSKTKGCSGISMSIPTGIHCVRFRLGQLTPIRGEELTTLATGVLHITTKRLLFNGDRRNCNVTLGRIIGTSLFRDAAEIEKSTGRSDYFFMQALYGRYIAAIIDLLKHRR
jgi:hypothetical protein